MSKIISIHAREILDSRGNPTISVKVKTEAGGIGEAMVPSGASTGENEAWELRDGSIDGLSEVIKNKWFGQRGVSIAVKNVNEIIAPKLIDWEVAAQRELDQIMIKMDNTPNKRSLGANAILGVSLAIAKAAADERGLSLYRYLGGVNAYKLPLPMLNVLNGGAHASNTLDFQEFMIVPIGAKSFKEALQMANKTFHTLSKLLKDAKHSVAVGDEGGFAPNLKSHEEALDFMVRAIQDAGYTPATKGDKAIAIAMDPASSEFYDKDQNKYIFKKALKVGLVSLNGENGLPKGSFTSEELVNYYEGLVNRYPIISIEDGHAENDWAGFKLMTTRLGKKIQIVGDDLFVTNLEFIKKGIDSGVANSVLIKLNQIGTISETIDAIQMAQKAKYTAVVSHRSGETSDTTIADLAVALNTGQIKTGSLSRTDRIAKYNRLLEIEEELKSCATFESIKGLYNLKN